ncbi:MAG: radical SAM protein [Bacillota bacterium]
MNLSATDQLKKFLADTALNYAINYLARDPEANLPRLLGLIEKVATEPAHKEAVSLFRDRVCGDPKVMLQVKRLATNPRMVKKFISNWVIASQFLGAPRRRALEKELGIHIPSLILIDPTSACNLKCPGCWAGEYKKTDSLEPELFSRIISEAKSLGIYWIVLSGGEPFAYPHLLDVIAEHPDVGFMAYTNGTLITEKVADRLAELANLSPAFSLEGPRELTDRRRGEGVFDRVMKSMAMLRERGVLFGASLTVTRENAEVIFSDEFVDFLVDQGVVYCWSFHYMPVGRTPNLELMITPEQRAMLARRVPVVRGTKPILMADFWNDGFATEGCIAGGRMYFHINAAGDVEPCAFVHFAVDNIRNKSLKEVLASPLFKAYQARQPFNKNHLAPCPIIDAPQALRDIVKESGAKPTHPGAEEILQGQLAAHLDAYSKTWLKLADQVLREREHKEQKVAAVS